LPESPEKSSDCAVMLCDTCLSQINSSDNLDEKHWRCLNDSMWSQVPAVKGSSLVIKRGTAVRNIGLTDNPLHIQGRENGTAMVIISVYSEKI